MNEPLIRNGDLITIKMLDETVHRCIVMDEKPTDDGYGQKLSCLRDWTNDEKDTHDSHPNH